MRTGCRISRVRMKNGGADVSIIDTPKRGTFWHTHPDGEVMIRTYGGKGLSLERALFLLETAKQDVFSADVTPPTGDEAA